MMVCLFLWGNVCYNAVEVNGMDVLARLKGLGFKWTIVLDGPCCGVAEKTLILALWTYEAEAEPDGREAWIHPYYRISHHAYQAAKQLVAEGSAAGLPIALRDDVRLKPIFARLPGFSQGRNTLSYIEGVGSRFYVKTFSLDMPMPADVELEGENHPLHCGECRRCVEACPGGAITENGFVAEKCIRYWMLSGKAAPEDVHAAMGNRLIGCDECQRCCPHNHPPAGERGENANLLRLLTEPKTMAEELKNVIGVNLTLPNRLLAQSCLIAGNSGRDELLPALEKLCEHPSQAVREHAAWAMENIRKNQV